jgi:hypothetical protein
MRVSLSARSTEPLLAAELPQAFRLRLRPGRCLCPLGRSPFRAPSQAGDDEDRKGRAGECEGLVQPLTAEQPSDDGAGIIWSLAMVARKLRAGQGVSNHIRADCCDHEKGSFRVAGHLGHLYELLESV